jgi:Prokaryotic E2 family E
VSVAEVENLLPELDREFLAQKEYVYTSAKVGGEVHLIIHDYDFPAAYLPRKADLLIILPAGYPNAHPDMFWTYPDVKRANGAWPVNSDQHQTYGDRNWQRWSRHYQGQWRAGIDGLRSYLAAVRTEVAKGV